MKITTLPNPETQARIQQGKHPCNGDPNYRQETLQPYVSQLAANITSSVKDLRGFQKMDLQPGKSRRVAFRITPDGLKFYHSPLEYDWEPGEFFIRKGGNSSQLKSTSLVWSQ